MIRIEGTIKEKEFELGDILVSQINSTTTELLMTIGAIEKLKFELLSLLDESMIKIKDDPAE